MSKSKSNPMTREAASRIVSATAKSNQGRIPAGSGATRVDRVMQQREGGARPGPKGKA